MIQAKSNISYPPWLSIVIPAYNAEGYIRSCVASIDPAAHSDIQVILVDDGSTDFTPSICNQISASYDNVLVIHKDNGGSASARNTGFEKATGTWTWFVDADDLISPTALEILKPVVGDSDSDAIQIGFVLFSDDEEPAWPVLTLSEKLETLTSDRFLSGIYHGRFQHFMWSFLLRTEVLRSRKEHTATLSRNDHGDYPFCENFSLYEDVVAIEELMRQFKLIDAIDLPVYGYRQVPTSITRRLNNDAAESGLRAVREIAHYDVSPADDDAKTRMEVSLLFSAYKLIDRSDGKSLRRDIEYEIDSRVKRVGVLRLGLPRLLRYALLKTRLLDAIIRLRKRM